MSGKLTLQYFRSIWGHLATYNFRENDSFKRLLLLHLWFKLFISVLCDHPCKSYVLELKNLKTSLNLKLWPSVKMKYDVLQISWKYLIRAKGAETGTSGTSVTYVWYPWRCSEQDHSGTIQCICLKMSRDHKFKEIEVCDLGGTCRTYMGYRRPCSFQFQFGSSSALTWYQGTSGQIYKCYILLSSSRTPRTMDLLFLTFKPVLGCRSPTQRNRP